MRKQDWRYPNNDETWGQDDFNILTEDRKLINKTIKKNKLFEKLNVK